MELLTPVDGGTQFIDAMNCATTLLPLLVGTVTLILFIRVTYRHDAGGLPDSPRLAKLRARLPDRAPSLVPY